MLLLVNAPCRAELRTWVVDGAGNFTGAEREGVQVHPDSMVLLAPMPEERNLALGKRVTDDLGNEVALTDGSIELIKGEWISGTPRVIGRHFTVDLEMDRAISRVRVLAGATALAQPEYFMRGYRIEAATQTNFEFWRLLAEDKKNFELNVDTAADSTWKVIDGEGRFLPRIGRYVRLELISQDRTNWVSLGEIEVFANGFVEEGYIEGEFPAVEPVNVGRAFWQAEVPRSTRVEMRFRGMGDGLEWPHWEDAERVDTGALFGGEEPVSRFQYRSELGTEDPFTTPSLRRIVVEYDPVLVARGVVGSVRPDTVRKGEVARFTYAAAMDVGAENYGIDLMRLDGIGLEVEEVRLNGGVLPYDEESASGYRWRHIQAEESTLIELAARERILQSGTVEIVGQGLLLQDWNRIQLQVGSREQGERDGYINWQNASDVRVRGMGNPLDLLDDIEITPQPFSPFRDGEMTFHFIVGNVREATQVGVEIFSLDGLRVRRLIQEGRARAYDFEWDGRDQDGEIVEPGLYLYEIRVETGNDNASRRGAFVVAY